MLSGSARQTTSPIAREINSSPEDFLRAIVDACVSNVAVLDESGSIIYASKAWSLFERNSADKNGTAYFENCQRSTQSETDEEAKITLADDIQDTGPQGEPYKLLELVVRFSRVVYRSLLART